MSTKEIASTGEETKSNKKAVSKKWKYIQLLPIIVYPYAYIFYFLFFLSAFTKPEYISDSEQVVEFLRFFSDKLSVISNTNPRLFLFLLIAVAVIINVLPLIIAIKNVVFGIKGKYTARQTAKMNLIVKLCQIPIYIFHFLMAILGLLMSVWGIGLIIVAVTVDLITIILTGINALGCPIGLYKQGRISKAAAALLCIGSFVYCVDIGVAVALCCTAKKAE